MRFYIFLIIFLVSGLARAGNQCQDLFGGQQPPYREDLAFGQQIYDRELNKLSRAFSSIEDLKWSEKIAKLVGDDQRKIFFHLRVLSQTYKSLDAKFFKEQEAFFKRFEYLLGRVQLYESLSVILEKLDEPEVALVFKEQQLAAAKDLKKEFKDIGMQKNPRRSIEKIKQDIDDFNWDSPERDRKFLVRETIDYANELKKNIYANAYDSDDLEKGLHKLRRRLRELVYRIVNLDGFVVLVEEKTLPLQLDMWHSQLIMSHPDLLEDRYLPTSSPEISSPIKIGRKAASTLAAVVTEIGLAKDKDEPLFYIEAAIRNGDFSSATKKRARRKLKGMESVSVDSRQVANLYQKRIRDSQLLESIIAYLTVNNP